VTINGLRPFLSEILPKYGRRNVRERENAPKIRLIYRPLAPRSWAYTGRSGTTIPTPVTDVKMEKKIVANIFLSDEFIWKGKD